MRSRGNAETLASRAELLHKTDVRLAQLYAQRSGRGEEFYAALMAENNGGGRWLSAEEAVSAGLADRIFDGLMTGVILPEGTPLPPQKGDGAADGETRPRSRAATPPRARRYLRRGPRSPTRMLRARLSRRRPRPWRAMW
ncbi:MAG: ATP-dependent Clp protease proteolytic subunit [Bacteroidales bacterium]|nr:MAG: ATP-dependent Clp protease proteolytic subunit [Bacteroidales bacterium]